MDNGWMRCDAFLTRSGVFLYQNVDGTSRREYRPPDEVFKADSLESFDLVPLTNDHPAEGMLTAENTQRYQVGTVIAPKQDGDKVRSQIMVTDAKAVSELESGKTQLSCGYSADLEETPGVSPEGEHYDCIQRNIRGNHVAIVAAGRAGPDIRVRMDTGDSVMVTCDSADSFSNRATGSPAQETRMSKIKFDSAELEVTEEVAKAIQAEREASAAALQAAKVEGEKTSARADAAQAEIASLKAELSAAPEKVRAQIQARMALESIVQSRLPELKAAEFSTLDLKKAFIVATLPEMKLDGKSDTYVEAAFELAQVQTPAPKTAPVEARADSDDLLEKQRKFYEASRNAYKTRK
jgi:hypothetical protein